MTFQVAWGRQEATTVATVADLDAVLDRIEARPAPLPYSVTIIRPDGTDLPPMLEIGVGHPHRSFAYHVGADGTSAWAHEPGLTPVDDFTFDHGGTATDAWPERTRVSPAAARCAAREFVTTDGHRPTCLRWDSDAG